MHKTLILVACLLAGCSTTTTYTALDRVPNSLPGPIAVPDMPFVYLNQMLVGELHGEKQRLNVVVKRNDDGLLFVGLSPSGLELYRLSYDGEKIEADVSDFVPDEFHPWHVVSQFLAMHAPKQALVEHLKTHGWLVAEQAKPFRRTVSRPTENGPEKFVSITCKRGCLQGGVLANHPQDFRLKTQTLERE